MRVQFLLTLLMFIPACSPKKIAINNELILPVSVRSIDSVSIDENNNIHYRITIVSPLPESLFIARPDFQRSNGDTTTFTMKYQTVVPDSSKQFVGAYEKSSDGNMNFNTPLSKSSVIRLRFWCDSVSTTDTVLHLK